jgi:hypothetical protein
MRMAMTVACIFNGDMMRQKRGSVADFGRQYVSTRTLLANVVVSYHFNNSSTFFVPGKLANLQNIRAIFYYF